MNLLLDCSVLAFLRENFELDVSSNKESFPIYQTNLIQLTSGAEGPRNMFLLGQREERHISPRENKYFEEVSVPGEAHPQERCRLCGWTSSSPRCDPRQSQAILEAFV